MDALEFAQGPMNAEWETWQDVVYEAKELRLDFNAGGNAEHLHNAIVRWGEHLVALRIADPEPEHIAAAFAHRDAGYTPRRPG